MSAIDYKAIQNGDGKDFMLRFLPYLETRDGKPVADVIGYEPAWVRRGYGYGRWEECFYTVQEARTRMGFLTASGAIEDCELHQSTDGRLGYRVLDQWRDTSNGGNSNEMG